MRRASSWAPLVFAVVLISLVSYFRFPATPSGTVNFEATALLAARRRAHSFQPPVPAEELEAQLPSPAAVAVPWDFMMGEVQEGDWVFLAPGIDEAEGLRAGVLATVLDVDYDGDITVKEEATGLKRGYFKVWQLALAIWPNAVHAALWLKRDNNMTLAVLRAWPEVRMTGISYKCSFLQYGVDSLVQYSVPWRGRV